MQKIAKLFKILFSKLGIQAKIVFWKFKYVSEDMIRH